MSEEKGMPTIPSMPSLALSSEVRAEETATESDGPVKSPPKKGHEVIAIAKGFWGNHRKVEGDRFTVPTVPQMGSWMKCVDPAVERQHQAHMKAKRSTVLADKTTAEE